jgi:hypothetical protein
VSGFGQKVMNTLETYAIFPYDPFEYRLSFFVGSFFTVYNLQCFVVELRVIEIRVLRNIFWP